ncbi:hypothetical protein, conserved [Eimeria tenella]|uniref:Uncharacterized protein n=1 Tax=Eimeria tenella TaxID=5802 RepID=U6KM77_EIMTE|nr:hypothetical protein, conserved [Eimeria tenella]CDJ37906.1 hypothetical protein, conserved [Eimeria tenella]|eukprot:XP_013228744.1 hypothetical protein, conserved [Eimeria tenella]
MVASTAAHKEQRQQWGDAQDYRVLGDDKTTVFSLPHLSLAHGPLRSTSGHPQRRFQDRRRNSLPRFLAATALILSILVIGVICKAAREVPQRQPGSTPRRLASGWLPDESAELCQIAEHCLELEADMGIAQPPAQATAGAESASMIESLVAMLQEAAEAHEQQRTEGTECLSGPQVIMYPSSEDSANPALNGSFANLSDNEGGSSSFPYSLTHAEGGEYVKGSLQREHSGFLHTATPTGAMGMEPRADSSLTGPSLGTQQFLYLDMVFLEAWRLPMHPFVRLPSVEAGVSPRKLRPSRLFLHQRTNVSAYAYFSTLRELFLRRSLDKGSADAIMDAIEDLADVAWTQTSCRARQIRPALAVSALGRDFLALDFIVCAIQLFRDEMRLHMWWEKFASAFRTNYSFKGSGLRRPRLRNFNTQLANRLLRVIDIYKQGNRPPLPEVIEIKRLLFCSPLAPKPFTDSPYNPWRNDDQAFLEGQ